MSLYGVTCATWNVDKVWLQSAVPSYDWAAMQRDEGITHSPLHLLDSAMLTWKQS